MYADKFLQQTLTDIKVKLEAEFKENFTRKAFFNEKWKTLKSPNSRGSLMLRSGNLRGSILGKIQGNSIVFSSSMPYASIHNEGGEFVVTEKMKKFFWAKYIEAGKKSATAQYWKGLALKKIGDKIKIEKRQFLGFHDQTDKIIKEIFNHNFKELKEEMDKIIKKK